MTADPTFAATARPPGRRPMRRLHKLMLLLAFEVLVFGFSQAQLTRPTRGISVETTVTPNHAVT